MTEQTQWPDDNLIADLIYRMTREYTELLTHELMDADGDLSGLPGSPADVDTRLWVEVTDLLVLSPPRIWDAFHSFDEAGSESYNTNVDDGVAYLANALADWDGPAATAFSQHVSSIRGFLDAHRGYVEEMLLGYAAAYKLAVQVRESYQHLVEEWIEVSRQFREDDDERRRAVKIKVGAGVLGAVLAAATGGGAVAVGLGASSAILGAAAEESTAELGGTTGGDVWQSYEKAFRKLADANEASMEEIRKFTQDANDRIAGEKIALYEPLPSVTDVDSPDFRYEHFYHDSVGGGYSHDVDVARPKYVNEKNASGFRADSPITLVLDGG
ncbi:hypothetical protein [Actinokineospora sp.]|uniref:hypothetical protein n=1 Tax=Actinokineospora sp. TaxID=1872133 RepID=UPI004037A02D